MIGVKSPVYAAAAPTVSAIVYFTAYIPKSRYRLIRPLDGLRHRSRSWSRR
jgi:hypothetical protein